MKKLGDSRVEQRPSDSFKSDSHSIDNSSSKESKKSGEEDEDSEEYSGSEESNSMYNSRSEYSQTDTEGSQSKDNESSPEDVNIYLSQFSQDFSSSEESKETEVVKNLEDVNNQPYAYSSMFCLYLDHPFRVKIITLVRNKWFERFILLTIIANCVFLAIDDPTQDQLLYQLIADYLFQLIFTAEATLKIIAMGFAFEPYTYLRNAWNVVIFSLIVTFLQLDFLVVVMGWMGQFFTAGNVSAIRVIRVLRPLRTISSIPSMRRLVQSLITSLPAMLDIFILFTFFLVMFGTVGTQLFGGLLEKRCVNSQTKEIYLDDEGHERFCNDILSCEQGQCIRIGNPDYGVTSFDNILKSDLNIFIVITLEGWTDIMYNIRHATGGTFYDFYFVIVVIFGSYFVINLMVAVQYSYLSQSFQEQIAQDEKENADNQQNLDELKLTEQLDQPGINIEQALDNEQKDGKENQSERNSSKKVIKLPKKIVRKSLKHSKCLIHYNKIQKKANTLINKRQFNILVIVCILINTILMAMDFYAMPKKMDETLGIMNTIMTCLFAIEMFLKIIGLGPKQYVFDGFNNFDAIVVIFGILEFANVGSKALTVLRIFRLLRLFKIVRQWKSLQKILVTVLKSFKSLANLALLMLLLTFIYALIGMQLLHGDIPDNDDNSFRYNFNSLGNSMITIFVLLTAENWNVILQKFILKDGWIVNVYFITIIVFGNIMLLNLFLAVLLNFIQDNMGEEELVQEVIQDTDQKLAVEIVVPDILPTLNKPNSKIDSSSKPISANTFAIQVQKVELLENEASINDESKSFEKRKDPLFEASPNISPDVAVAPILKKSTTQFLRKTVTMEPIKKIQHDNYRKISTRARAVLIKQYNIYGKSLFLFSSDNKFRLIMKMVLEHPYFEPIALNFILLNTLLMALDQPDLRDNFQINAIELLTNIITGIYIAEAMLKIVVLGFVKGKGTYLKDPWNILDFSVVIFSISTWVISSISGIDVPFLRIFKAFRALRPLRMISKNGGLKVVVSSLLASIPSLIHVFMISILFLFAFGVLGVQLFKGAMGFCNDTSMQDIDSLKQYASGYKYDCVGTFTNTDGDVTDRLWKVPFNNFDNIFYSILTFFEITTLESWPDILYATIDSQGEDLGPVLNNRPYIAILFIAFIFITTFFVMNLFISVIVDKFNTELRRKQRQGLNEEQQEWIKLQMDMSKMSAQIHIPMPRNKIRKFLYKMVQSNTFEYFIMLMVLANTVVLCMDYVNEPTDYKNILDLSNIAFVVIFTVEAILKLVAFGIKSYFLKLWNLFDFIIIILSILASNDQLFPVKFNALRIVRVARLLRMIKASKGLRKMLKALWLSLKSIANISLILFLIFFTFTVAGQQLFGDLINGQQINQDANFKSFWKAILTLFRASTGENWNGIMHDCNEQVGGIAVFYFVVFQIITKYIFLNIFIAVIFENFNEVQSEYTKEILNINKKDIESFFATWAVFCPLGDYYMKANIFCAFLQELPQPFGYKGVQFSTSSFNSLIHDLNLRVHIRNKSNVCVYLPEAFFALFTQKCGNIGWALLKGKHIRYLMSAIRKKYKQLPSDISYRALCGRQEFIEITLSKYLVGLKFYKAWKQHKRFMTAKIDPRWHQNDQILKEEIKKRSFMKTKKFQSNLDIMVNRFQANEELFQLPQESPVSNDDIRIDLNLVRDQSTKSHHSLAKSMNQYTLRKQFNALSKIVETQVNKDNNVLKGQKTDRPGRMFAIDQEISFTDPNDRSDKCKTDKTQQTHKDIDEKSFKSLTDVSEGPKPQVMRKKKTDRYNDTSNTPRIEEAKPQIIAAPSAIRRKNRIRVTNRTQKPLFMKPQS